MSESSGEKASALVLIPARNEVATIGRVVAGCRRAGFTVMVIDDGSSDATALLAGQSGANVLSVTGPHHGENGCASHRASPIADIRRMALLSRWRWSASPRRS